MATNLARLKGKGAPPVADAAPDVITDDPRHEAEPQRPIQVRVPESVFMEFSEQAGRGAKKQLFLKMWKAYKAQRR